MSEILIILTVTAAALLTGNEFTVGMFIHPALSRLDDKSHVSGVQQIGRHFGKVMPFWMAAVVLLCLTLVFTAAPYFTFSWWLFAAAAAFYIGGTVFSLLGPVPINNQVVKWNTDDLPDDWRVLRKRWDDLHLIRVAILLLGLVSLIAGITLR